LKVRSTGSSPVVSRVCVLDAGGDVVVRGSGLDEPWRIGIQHPWQRDNVADVLFVTSGAVASSGRTNAATM